MLIVPISITLALPSPAFALRQLNAGMEESPVRRELGEHLGRMVGLEEGAWPRHAERFKTLMGALQQPLRSDSKVLRSLSALYEQGDLTDAAIRFLPMRPNLSAADTHFRRVLWFTGRRLLEAWVEGVEQSASDAPPDRRLQALIRQFSRDLVPLQGNIAHLMTYLGRQSTRYLSVESDGIQERPLPDIHHELPQLARAYFARRVRIPVRHVIMAPETARVLWALAAVGINEDVPAGIHRILLDDQQRPHHLLFVNTSQSEFRILITLAHEAAHATQIAWKDRYEPRRTEWGRAVMEGLQATQEYRQISPLLHANTRLGELTRRALSSAHQQAMFTEAYRAAWEDSSRRTALDPAGLMDDMHRQLWLLLTVYERTYIAERAFVEILAAMMAHNPGGWEPPLSALWNHGDQEPLEQVLGKARLWALDGFLERLPPGTFSDDSERDRRVAYGLAKALILDRHPGEDYPPTVRQRVSAVGISLKSTLRVLRKPAVYVDGHYGPTAAHQQETEALILGLVKLAEAYVDTPTMPMENFYAHTNEFLQAHGYFKPHVAGGLEERPRMMGRDMAVAAWREVPRMAGLEASARGSVFVFRDHLEVAALAVQQGMAVAVPMDGPEATGLEELLARVPGPKGPYAIGTSASARFLQEYPEASQIPITTRQQFFALVGLEEDHLLAPVRQALIATRDFLDLARSA